MKKNHKFNLGTLLTLGAVAYGVYYLLLYDNCFNCSISSIISNSHNLAIKKHLLVLGLLPIYIATMIFGAVVLAIYLGTALHQLIIRTTKSQIDK